MSPPSDYRRALRPPQFTLRTLIGLITLLAVFFSLVNLVHPLVMTGLVLLAVLIAAHVAGNVIGTRLRELGDRPVTKGGQDIPRRRFNPPIDQESFAPPSDLARKVSLGLPVLIVTAAGAAVGGFGGGLWGYLAAGSGGWLNIGVGCVAFGFLGGFVSFALYSFTQVLLAAWWQAVRPKSPIRRAENDARYPL
ncbi:MAG: hypothetical protein K8R36_19105 [Planctomycetales bacterium]|nr:hypothetical protein [Planctomycetales bacterium]